MFIKEQRVTKYQTEAVPPTRSGFPDFGLDPDFFELSSPDLVRFLLEESGIYLVGL